MPSKNEHQAESPLSEDQNSAMSDKPREGAGLAGKPGARAKTGVDKAVSHDLQNQATIEEFGQEGMGVAPKE